MPTPRAIPGAGAGGGGGVDKVTPTDPAGTVDSNGPADAGAGAVTAGAVAPDGANLPPAEPVTNTAIPGGALTVQQAPAGNTGNTPVPPLPLASLGSGNFGAQLLGSGGSGDLSGLQSERSLTLSWGQLTDRPGSMSLEVRGRLV
jgi:hypothetical protein